MDAIVVEGLEKTYPKGVRALDGVSFAVREGEVFGLLGPNGAGKSTTVRVLVTLTRPDAGRAEVAGGEVLEAPAAVRRAIGYVAQQSGLDREGTGRENLTLQARMHGLGGKALRRRAQERLELLGLADAADRMVRTYSGGMKRRLDISLGPRQSARRPLPRRADDRARPGGPRPHVGGAGAPRERGVAHDPPHHALPGGSPTGSPTASQS